MKSPLLLILIISLPFLSTAQNQERYIKYLDAALAAAEKKDSVKVIENLEYFSTAIEVDNITPEKLEKSVLDKYTKVLYYSMINKISLPQKIGVKAVSFIKYGVDTKPENMFCLGYLYDAGIGVEQNYKEAEKWYKKATDKGHAVSPYNLALLYINKHVQPPNDQESTKLLKMAAEKGLDDAQMALGIYYEYLDKNYLAAYNWYLKAAKQNYLKAQAKLADLYYRGLGTKQDYLEALKWYKKAADNGHPNSQNSLGDMYYNGYGVTESYEEAVKWYKKAAEQENSISQSKLGEMYYKGHGVSKNYEEAIKWFRKSAEQGNSDGQALLGLMYQMGYGISQNYEEALKWYRKAAEQENSSSQIFLAFMYYRGYGVAQSFEQAIKWLKKSANKGDAIAMNHLGTLYENVKNKEEASFWYKKACEKERTESCEALKKL